MKRFHWFEIALVTAVMAAHIYAAFSEAHNFPQVWFSRDDAYFYFKTAQNISEGRGPTFDGINLSNGYHPLWMLVCIPIFALARFDLILPLRLLVLVLGALSAGAGVLLFRLLRRALAEPVAMLAAAYWVFNLYIHTVVTRFGLETGLLVFAILLALRRLQTFEDQAKTAPVRKGQILQLAALAVLVLLSRLDMVFLAGLIGLWALLRGTPLRYYVILDALLTVTAVLVGFFARLGFPQYYDYAASALAMAGGLLVLRLPLIYLLGLDERPGHLKVAPMLARTLLVVLASSGVCALALSILGARLNGFPRSVVLLESGLSFALLAAVRLGALWFRPRESAALQVNWKRLLQEGLIFYGLLAGVLGAYLLFNQATFGTATPVSGQVKRWWGSPLNQVRDGPARTLDAFLGLDRNGDFNAWPQITPSADALSVLVRATILPGPTLPQVYRLVLATGVLILFAILLWNRRRALRSVHTLGLVPLFAGCGFQLFGYNATGYSAAKEWYWAGQMLFTVCLAALTVDLLLHRWLERPKLRTALIICAAALSLIGFGRYAEDIITSMPLAGKSEAGYVDALTFLQDHTAPGDLIAVTGGGNLGYFLPDRTIVNMDGLINSHAYFEALQAGTAADFLYDMGIDYVFASPRLLNQLAPFKSQFRGRLLRSDITYGGKELMTILPSQP